MPDIWTLLLQPLILISGVGVLLLSTTARFGQLEAELKDIPGGDAYDTAFIGHLLDRAKRYRLALSTLYVAVALLCIASIGGAVLSVFVSWAGMMVNGLTSLAFIAVLVSAATLVRESTHATELFALQLKQKFPEPGTDS